MSAIRRLLLCAALAAALPAAAQGLAAYQGADRMDRIVAAAKKEASLTLYTTIAEKDIAPIVKPFAEKYGVKGNVSRAGTDKGLQRAVTEAKARRYTMDVVHFGAPEMEALSLEKNLSPGSTPTPKYLQPPPFTPHGQCAP